MKLKFIYTLFIASLGAVLFLSNSNGRASSANWGNTGAPGDQTLSNGEPRTCQSCHSTSDMQLQMDIEVSSGGNVVENYIPGNTYDVTIRLNHTGGSMPSGFGFQVVALVDSDESSTESWSNPSANAKIATASNTGRSYVEQNGISDTNTFGMQWTAPEMGSGNITFYACGIGINGNGMTSGDGATINTLSLTEDEGTNINELEEILTINLYPNPAQDWLFLNMEASDNIQKGMLQIINQQGQIMLNQAIADASNWQQRIAISSLSTGIYFVKIANEKGILTKRFVKL